MRSLSGAGAGFVHLFRLACALNRPRAKPLHCGLASNQLNIGTNFSWLVGECREFNGRARVSKCCKIQIDSSTRGGRSSKLAPKSLPTVMIVKHKSAPKRKPRSSFSLISVFSAELLLVYLVGLAPAGRRSSVCTGKFCFARSTSLAPEPQLNPI